MQRDTAKWLFIAALLGAAFLVWLHWNDLKRMVIQRALPAPVAVPAQEPPQLDPVVTDADPGTVEVKSLHPGPKPGEKVYTEEDIRQINDKNAQPARHPATYTNYDVRKYHIRRPTGDVEKMRNELKWVDEPEPKKTTRSRNPSH